MKKCADCGKRRSDGWFRPDGRHADNLAPTCRECEKTEHAELETVSLEGVEILAAGGPYHGRGSPPEGDFYDVEFLEAIAAANRALAGEVEAPLKLGHNREQKLLRESGLADDEKPAAGWLSNFRVAGDKLLADITDVPRKIADLMKAKAFRKRSVELSRIESQREGGTVHEAVVTGLALLGAKAPAVRTLDDVIALYGEGADTTELLRQDEDGDPGVRLAKDAPIEATVTRYVDAGAAEVAERAPEQLNLIPGTNVANAAAPADTSPRMSTTATETPSATLSDEQVASLATTFGIEDEDAAGLRAKVVAKLAEFASDPSTPPADPPPADPPPATPPVVHENAEREFVQVPAAEWENVKLSANVARELAESTRVARRGEVLTRALAAGKFHPAKLADWQRRYDENEDSTVAILAEIEPSNELRRIYGVDAEGIAAEGSGYTDFERAHLAQSGIATEVTGA